ncbi:transposase family protein [Actinokineospora auranticolor]|uniref:DDE superfamily endonuclease n=1 Tax=Actinokineospora auranticolor TaxID=155976 RepID=A0A2S6GHY7_9PSEU|nr:transposase [Actinokineospora auranticolor]PPK64803.1 DDE superfamily endonuclease [Actinokineospora auranticolor]
MVQVISADRPEWVPVFTGLSVRAFRKLVRAVAARGGEQTGAGRWWGLSLADRVLLVAVYYRTNLTFRQVALLFGISRSAANRAVDHLAPLLALSPVTRKHSPDTVLIVDGTLVPTHDRGMSASSKNYRYSVNMQVVIDANTRLVIAVGEPTPGNRNDCRAYTDSGVDEQCRGAKVMADGGYQGNPEVIMPYRKPRKGQPPLPQWKEDLNTIHKSVRARVEHALAHMKSWNILRNCRRKRDGVWYATRGVAQMRNLAMTA